MSALRASRSASSFSLPISRDPTLRWLRSAPTSVSRRRRSSSKASTRSTLPGSSPVLAIPSFTNSGCSRSSRMSSMTCSLPTFDMSPDIAVGIDDGAGQLALCSDRASQAQSESPGDQGPDLRHIGRLAALGKNTGDPCADALHRAGQEQGPRREGRLPACFRSALLEDTRCAIEHALVREELDKQIRKSAADLLLICQVRELFPGCPEHTHDHTPKNVWGKRIASS